MRKFSVIIPIYNRPDELKELLSSLERQTYKNFEIIIIEDGSSLKSEEVANAFSKTLDIKYFFKENQGQGFARNFGFKKATGDYFIQFDSDALIPENYFEVVNKHFETAYLDAFGGPDAAHESFTDTQKAINYAMTSFFTTGGTRGKGKNLGGKFHPRSFNFGLSREVFEKVGGYVITRMGEDIEYSIRIINAGFKVGIIEDAFIYHKRRTSLIQFFKQLFFFGRARVNIGRFFKKELKAVHLFPVIFMLFTVSFPIQYLINIRMFNFSIFTFVFYFITIFIDAMRQNKSLMVAIKSTIASFIQLFAYGCGFVKELVFGRKSQAISPF